MATVPSCARVRSVRLPAAVHSDILRGQEPIDRCTPLHKGSERFGGDCDVQCVGDYVWYGLVRSFVWC